MISTSIFTITLIEVTSLETNIVLVFFAFIFMSNIFQMRLYPANKYVLVNNTFILFVLPFNYVYIYPGDPYVFIKTKTMRVYCHKMN